MQYPVSGTHLPSTNQIVFPKYVHALKITNTCFLKMESWFAINWNGKNDFFLISNKYTARSLLILLFFSKSDPVKYYS